MCNLSTFIVQNEAELVVRMTFQATKKIDIVRSLNKAKFVADLYCNFTRLGAFTSLLVDEGESRCKLFSSFANVNVGCYLLIRVASVSHHHDGVT